MWPFKKKEVKKHFKLWTLSSGPQEGSVIVINDQWHTISDADVPYGENGTGQDYVCYLDWKNVQYDMDGDFADLYYCIIRSVEKGYDPKAEFKKNPNPEPEPLFV